MPFPPQGAGLSSAEADTKIATHAAIATVHQDAPALIATHKAIATDHQNAPALIATHAGISDVHHTPASASGLAIFGDGSDGDVTINANTTLTRDMFYDDLTVDATKILTTAGFRIFAKGTLTNNGTIRCDGGDAVADVAGDAPAKGSIGGGGAGGNGAISGAGNDYGGGGGAGGGVLLIAAKTIDNSGGVISANGGDGADGAGGAALTNLNGDAGTGQSPSLGNDGGQGGDTAAKVGGAAGVATAPTTSEGGSKTLPFATLLKDEVNEFLGGGGGGGGSASMLPVQHSGGGGGGGGGFVIIVYNAATWGTEQANGGALGLKWSVGGDDGVAGSNGSVVKIANA